MTQYATSQFLGQVLSVDCPSREVLEHISNKWSILVLRCLRDGVHRFSELKQKIEGISEKMLAQTLKQLEQDGFILRTIYPVVPPKVEYQLTILGSQLTDQIMPLLTWLEHHVADLIAARQTVIR